MTNQGDTITSQLTDITVVYVFKLHTCNCTLLSLSVCSRLGVSASVYEQIILFLYRYPPASRLVLAASVHLPLTLNMTGMSVNVNRHDGNHVYMDMTVIC